MSIKNQSVFEQLKKSVTFLFAEINDEIKAIGTGFFVCVQIEGKDVPLDEIESNYFEVYLITAKHVLQKDHKLFDKIYLRLNRKNQNPVLLPFEINKNNTYLHPDESVDLICCICCPNPEEFDYIWIPTVYLPSKNTLSENIQIGNEIIHLGLFANYMGKERNHPVFRFGRISMLTEEKIEINAYNEPTKLAHIYLGEIQSFPGNSGSPVFVQLPRLRPPNQIRFGEPETYLFGVLKGHYNDIRLRKFVDLEDNILQSLNNGIAMITPSYLIREILFSSIVSKRRIEMARKEGIP
jgi:hypothetical protein